MQVAAALHLSGLFPHIVLWNCLLSAIAVFACMHAVHHAVKCPSNT